MTAKKETVHYEALIRAAETAKAAAADVRKRAAQWFLENGFPNVRQEAWRFTDVSPIAAVPFRPAPPSEAAVDGRSLPFDFGDLPRLVWVNGRFRRDLSLPPNGIVAQSLAAAADEQSDSISEYLNRSVDYSENGFVALNTTLWSDGLYLRVPAGRIEEQPLVLLFVTETSGSPVLTLPRNLIVVGREARLTLIESHVSLGDDVHLTNAVTEIVVEEQATLEHVKLQGENEASFHTAYIGVRQGRNSNYRSHLYAFGNRLARTDLKVELSGEGADCTLNGLYLARNRQLIDTHTLIEHAAPHCTSRELYKGILADKAHAVFNGKIHVRPAAQKTDAVQSNRNLLLSDEAIVDTQPQLEIYADDVRCTHGGTVGRLDDDALFYLRSRGIGQEEAGRMLIRAFADEVIEALPAESLQEQAARLVDERLAVQL